jgi:hypothetical protein
MVAHFVRDEGVGGSSPLTPIFFKSLAAAIPDGGCGCFWPDFQISQF